MFTITQKRDLADAIQTLLRATNDPELPEGEISFTLHVQSKHDHRFPEVIRNNETVAVPTSAVEEHPLEDDN